MLVGTHSGKLYAVVVRTGIFAGSATLALGLLGSSAALAQNCGNLTLSGGQTGTIQPIGSGLSAGIAIASAVSAANTAFLTQSTAFVSAPANPKPNSEGSGIWIRGVGGELTLNSNTSVSAKESFPGVSGFPSTGSTGCSAQFHQTFSGFQLGQDVAKLNVGGWNLTLGATAGFLETNGNITGGNVYGGGAFNSTTQAPFIGTYATATYGSFFIDGLVRADYFETDLDSPTAHIFGQNVDAHGFTVAASAGYNWQIPNTKWFFEPSAGVVWSRETVDPFNSANPVTDTTSSSFASGNFSGTTRVSPIESVIGRVGVRVGTTVDTDKVVYQPFAAVSVWHDFAGDQTANYSSCVNCIFMGQTPGALTASMSTNNIGTFGQYSLGVSAALKDTGWLGFVRADYREGPEMHGLSGTGGIRYQFSPTAAAGVMPVKAKAPVGVDHPVDWTGWYAGAIGGATGHGLSSTTFPASQTFVGSTADIRPSGWLGGGTLGYNFQRDRWVFGVEGDIAKTNTSGSSPCAPLAGQTDAGVTKSLPVALFQTTCHDDLDWIATATARIGYAWTPRTLFYIKAGGAFADESYSYTCNLGPFNGPNVNRSNGSPSSQNCYSPASFNPNDPTVGLVNQASAGGTRVGWTVGFGTEFALTDRWSIKSELDWLDFGSKSYTLSDGTAVNSSLHIAQGKIGINYKFWP